MFDRVMGTDQVRLQMADGKPAAEIIESWQPEVERFKAERRKYFLYE
jgi:uncharacterized protein YbbC (DUF1343 family)